ncbi:cysteine-rich receptor-like protein kinase 25 isoform X1 [Nymphaea colorata]|nr:cysteine-rich receptor-like protein kinase 25 isoform X1 [Nymphaea colorata]
MVMAATRCLSLFIFLLPLFLVAEAQSPYYNCPNTGPTYAAGSAYQKDLNTLLASLRANASVSPSLFYNTTVGRSPDQVYGLVQCHTDISPDDCSFCAVSSASQILQVCPSAKIAVIWFDNCLLRYSSVDFFGVVDSSQLALVNTDGISNPSQFKPVAISFFNNLSASATTDKSSLSYATGAVPYTDNTTLYSLVECTRDLSPKFCDSCLSNSIRSMSQCCIDKQGARILSGSCVIRYEIYPFFGNLSTLTPSMFDNVSLVGHNCPADTNQRSNGSFRQNLNMLLDSLSTANTTPTSLRSEVNKVYGQFQCRGDVPEDVCRRCAKSASTRIPDLCPDSVSAIVWFNYCQLRYSNTSFFGKLDIMDKYYSAPKGRPPEFSFTLGTLINNLTTLATTKDSPNMFETGSRAFNGSQTLYALVQCTDDISRSDCYKCLDTLPGEIQSVSRSSERAILLTGSCRAEYGLTKFFFDQQVNVTVPTGTGTGTDEPNSTRPPPTSSGGQGRKSSKRIVIIASSIASVFMVVCALCLVQQRRRHMEKQRYRHEVTMLDIGSDDQLEKTHDLPTVRFRTVRIATDNFSESNKLGQGGFGPVYKGILPNGQEVAVKRLSRHSLQGLSEYKNEVNLIGNLQHKNLVRLLGCCLEEDEMMLIYEYLPNKSVDAFLNDAEKRALLDWEKRLNIIMGTARGMAYLHHDSRLSIIHRDLKAANVLLDEQMNSKISDFGMARIFSGNQTQVNTKIIVGTYGYMSPEYAMDGLFSIKSDVYSFGILLLEIISGQLNRKFHHPHKEARSLVGYAWSLWREGKGLEFVDPLLRVTSPTREILRCIHIGLLCVQDDAESRPTMASVLLMLGSDSLALPVPTEPLFSSKRCVKVSSGPQSSVNGVTNTEVSPR